MVCRRVGMWDSHLYDQSPKAINEVDVYSNCIILQLNLLLGSVKDCANPIHMMCSGKIFPAI